MNFIPTLFRTKRIGWQAICLLSCCFSFSLVSAEDLLTINNDSVKVGIDREKGGAITWLSSDGYPRNIVNIADPGRLIQQSYYAGRRLDRTSEGQSKAWSPWTWNPIQGGGVGSAGGKGTWSRVTVFEKNANALYSETIPKLWDMADEEADAMMRQWTTLEENLSGVVCVRCEIQSMRREGDRWGAARNSPQEVPACYFTRNFDSVRSYLGAGKWRNEHQPPGPPWGRANPPLKAMAMFESSGQGVAVYSPTSGEIWNYGPHGGGLSDAPTDGPCMHVAPIDRVLLGYKSTFRYRYWLIVGDETEISTRLDALNAKYAAERSQLIGP
ncbi:hypothetical protein CA13_61070 [Planctomycetes bacterium CA13]|uniref:YkuD domain-containing protein n=1 Tax=Novipirellula herctigrandis TaxID=2527986 RepID=A0A5C5ZBV6_9BACT|nr:hypothetical protein CA13_61070 [Planctomycetes bacterium CA13]